MDPRCGWEIVAHGYSDRGYIDRTLLRFAGVPVTFQLTAFADLRPPPEVPEDPEPVSAEGLRIGRIASQPRLQRRPTGVLIYQRESEDHAH
jgi:hypothetical protein